MKLGIWWFVLAVLVACGGGDSKKEGPPGAADEKLEITVATPMKNPDGSITVRIGTQPYPAEVKLLGHATKTTHAPGAGIIGDITIPRAELKPGKATYEVTGELNSPDLHLTGKATFEYDNQGDPVPLTWTPLGKQAPVGLEYRDGVAADPVRLGGNLDQDGNVVVMVGGPSGTELTIDGQPLVLGDQPTAIKLPALAKLATMPPPGGTLYFPVQFATGATGSLSIFADHLGQQVFLPARTRPALLPGEAAGGGTRRNALYYGAVPRLLGKAATYADIDLIVMEETTSRKLPSCTYQGNFKVARSEETVVITVVDRRAGKVLEKKTFKDPQGSRCPEEIRADPSHGGSTWLQRPDQAEIDAWVAKQIQG
jgi:hypothetical protein